MATGAGLESVTAGGSSRSTAADAGRGSLATGAGLLGVAS